MKLARFIKVALVVAVLFIQSTAFGQTVQQGFTYLDNGQYTQAESAFKALASGTPSAENNYYLGNYYLAVGQPDAAKPYFDQGMAQDDRSALIHVGQGEVEIAKGNLAGAAPLFDRAKRLTRSRNAEVFYRIGLAYMRHDTKDISAAVEALNKAIELDNKVPDYYVALGDAYLATNNAGQAATNYDQALHLDPNLAKAHARKGDLHVRARNYTEGIKELQLAVASDANHLPAYRSLGDIYFLAKQYKNAAASYEQYITKTTPTPDDLFTYAGYLYLNNDYAKSLEQLQKLGQDYPNPIRHRLLGYNYYETKQYPQGLQHMQTFMQVAQPDVIIASDHEYLGRLNIEAGEDTLAGIASLHKAAEMDSSKQDIYRDIATMLYGSRMWADAAAEYQLMASKGIDLGVNDHLNQGRAYYYGAASADSVAQVQEYTKAAESFAKVTEAVPEERLGWLWRARASQALEDTELSQGLAKPYYEKVIELTTDPQEYTNDLIAANQYLTVHYYYKDDIANAQKYAQAWLTLAPEDETAKSILEWAANPDTAQSGAGQ